MIYVYKNWNRFNSVSIIAPLICILVSFLEHERKEPSYSQHVKKCIETPRTSGRQSRDPREGVLNVKSTQAVKYADKRPKSATLHIIVVREVTTFGKLKVKS